MDRLIQQSKNIEEFFGQTEHRFKSYQFETNLKCLAECGQCCLNPEVEARPTEAILIAMAIWDGKISGGVDFWLKNLKDKANTICAFLQDIPGKNCMCYKERPLVCRAFGAFRYGNSISVCKIIKENSSVEYQKELLQFKKNSESTPCLSEEIYKLSVITGELLEKPLPINQAVLSILERLVTYKSYTSNQPSSI